MSQRLFVYPVAFIALMQLAPLLRRDQRWYAAQIAQQLLLLVASAGAMMFEDDIRWVILAWGLFVAFIAAPRLFVRLRWWRWAGWLTWGQLGKLFCRYADALKLPAEEALALLDSLIASPLPETVRGDVRLFRLRLLKGTDAIEYYRSVDDWGTLASATRARLVVARAYAQTGDLENAVRSLQFVALSPRTVGDLDRQYQNVRAEIVELAGGMPDALRLADEQSAPWRALMSWAQPAPVTLILALMCAAIWLLDKSVGYTLWHSAGNVPEAVREGEWWRTITALFLHANFWHLAVNGVGLWMFGTAVERSLGRWRMLTIFILAGSLANFASTWTARYDVSVGASGGIFGLVAAFGVAVWRLRSPATAAVRSRLLRILAVMLVADLTIGGLEPQIDGLAHAGGFVIGLLLALALRPRGESGMVGDTRSREWRNWQTRRT